MTTDSTGMSGADSILMAQRMSGGGGGGKGGLLNAFLPDVGFNNMSIQGISYADKPICNASIFAAFGNMSLIPKHQGPLKNFAQIALEDFKRISDAGHQLLAQGAASSGAGSSGAPISAAGSGAPPAAGGDMSLA
jgi:hypothetical protein